MRMIRGIRVRHHSELIHPIVYDKFKPEMKPTVKTIIGSCNVCERFNSQKMTNQMIKGSDLRREGICKNGF